MSNVDQSMATGTFQDLYYPVSQQHRPDPSELTSNAHLNAEQGLDLLSTISRFDSFDPFLFVPSDVYS
jgi:hypothetical protein